MDTEWLQHPVVKGALGGAIAAAAIDIDAFRKWQSFQEAKSYNWSRAAWRWFQGAIIGAMAAAGLEAVA